jgi:hypothetical protein
VRGSAQLGEVAVCGCGLARRLCHPRLCLLITLVLSLLLKVQSDSLRLRI